MKYVSTASACKMLETCPNTLRSWANDRKIDFITLPSGHRRYNVESLLPKKDRKHIAYCRVSSAKQSDDLLRQQQYLRQHCGDVTVISDIGSGLNFKRKGFKSILEQLCRGEIETLTVAHRDRLCRFGWGIIEILAHQFGTKLVVLSEDADQSPESELIRDITSIIHVFSYRLHGLRKYKAEIKKDQTITHDRAETASA